MRERRELNFLVIVVPDVNSPGLESRLQADESPFDRPDLLLQELYVCTGEMIRVADCVSRGFFLTALWHSVFLCVRVKKEDAPILAAYCGCKN